MKSNQNVNQNKSKRSKLRATPSTRQLSKRAMLSKYAVQSFPEHLFLMKQTEYLHCKTDPPILKNTVQVNRNNLFFKISEESSVKQAFKPVLACSFSIEAAYSHFFVQFIREHQIFSTSRNESAQLKKTKDLSESDRQAAMNLTIVNRILQYPLHDPLWYVLKPDSSSSFGPVSTPDLLDMFTRNINSGHLYVRLLDGFCPPSLISKYFHLAEIAKSDLVKFAFEGIIYQPKQPK